MGTTSVPTENEANPEFQKAVRDGLQSQPKRISSRFLYDKKGSQLFELLMDQPEYYLTDCETHILKEHRAELAKLFENKSFNLIELGAGDGRKTIYLLEQFQQAGLEFTYCPVDISEGGMNHLIQLMNRKLPDLSINPIVGDYRKGFHKIDQQPHPLNVVLFLGSTMGNFGPSKSQQFLTDLRSHLTSGDYCLIGFDLKKEVDTLLKAYNDSQGITSRFNLNLLTRINRELRGHFDPDQFEHYGLFDPEIGAIKSYILSRQRQSISIDDLEMVVSFDAWEPIHIEVSHKYSLQSIEKLAHSSGFKVEQHFTDPKNYFVDSLWRVG